MSPAVPSGQGHHTTQSFQDLHSSIQAPYCRVDESSHNCVQDEGEDLREEGGRTEHEQKTQDPCCPFPLAPGDSGTGPGATWSWLPPVLQ